MKRRQFLGALAGTAAAWPLTARAQKSPMPLIVVVHGAVYDPATPRWVAFADGLKFGGYIENQNVRIEYRQVTAARTSSQIAAEVAEKAPDAIFAAGSAVAVAIKAAIRATPVVFASGGDPIKLGLVTSLSRPGFNVTGVTRLSHGLAVKQFELLRETVPDANKIVVAVNDDNPNTSHDLDELRTATGQLGTAIAVLKAKSGQELASALLAYDRRGVDAVLIGNDPAFANHSKQIVDALAKRQLPAIFPYREFVDDGGLMSYGAHITETYRQAGIYLARVLQGDKPAALPVQQAVRIALVINMKTAKTLGLNVPLSLLGRADEAIE